MKRARQSVGRHRAHVRPRYGRMTVLGASLAVTLIAVAGGFGVLPKGPDKSAAASSSLERTDRLLAQDDIAKAMALAESGQSGQDAPATDEPAADSAESATPALRPKLRKPADPAATDLPADSGDGRRIVFSESRQRVWLVGGEGGDDAVVRTYLASGSVYDNLDPGTYEVFSRSRWATGIDDSGTMEYFVRFTHGDEGAAIGFHTIPVDDGKPVQTVAQLGTPLSHGCIRQKRTDAIALWEFAPIGTTVVVTA